MKKLFLIISPYFIFCLIFSIPFILRPNKHNIKEEKKGDDVTIETPVDTSSFIIDSTIVPDEVVPDNSESLPQEFSIVIGSFKSQDKADKLKDKLNNLNFECSSHSLPNGLIRVTVGLGYSELELKDEFDSLKNLGYEPWIIKLQKDEFASN
jgi:hypothetical protein